MCTRQAFALMVFMSGMAGAQRNPSAAGITRLQATEVARFGERRAESAPGGSALVALAGTPALSVRNRDGSYWSVVASALAPGSGQALLGEQRFLPYAAFELFSWALYASHARDARARRREYRALASSVARAKFSANRPTGDFDYYERLEHYVESGLFDVVAGGDLDPETDTTTYNGSIWYLARRTFWKDVNLVPSRSSPEWQQAEMLYVRRAYRDDFLWSWRNAHLEFDEYRRLIRGANDASRRSIQDLGLIIANHALSLVDAFITVRLRRRTGSAGEVRELEVSFPALR
ncbi:MAG: hypothetical protein MNPFHGCM_01130 [Gemmatimonadaceae bacterium]|nr:hypothetical protein [Gemmatimonadaceae bacterium]